MARFIDKDATLKDFIQLKSQRLVMAKTKLNGILVHIAVELKS